MPGRGPISLAPRARAWDAGRVDNAPGTDPESDDELDVAVVAYRRAGEWQVDDLVTELLDDVGAIAAGLRRVPSDDGVALALISVEEDFLVLVRVVGDSTRVLLSDVTAAEEWDVAESALTLLGLTELALDAEDEDEPVPAGDLAMLADLGVSAEDLADLLEDDELLPEEVLSEIADQLGFGELFDDWVGLAPV